MGQIFYILKGLPASGKSTWAKNKAKKEFNTVIINRDKIREMLKGEYKLFPFGSKMEQVVTHIEEISIHAAMGHRYNIIIDATNFRFKLDYWRDYIKSYKDNYKIKVVDFTDVSVEECIERDSKREISIGREIIEKMYNKYLK